MNAIYVGKPTLAFDYGHTGTVRPWTASIWQFFPDSNYWTHKPSYLIPCRQIYIPSQDMRRHCPKP
jgi:hypothetical protein